MNIRVKTQRPLSPYEMGEVAKVISAHIREVQSHQFEEGMYEVRCLSTSIPLAYHHAVALVGKPANDFDQSFRGSIILHKIDAGVRWQTFEPPMWERLYKVPEADVAQALQRAWDTKDESWKALDNCEHWSTYVTRGIRESSQVQSFVKFSIGATIAYFLLKDDR